MTTPASRHSHRNDSQSSTLPGDVPTVLYVDDEVDSTLIQLLEFEGFNIHLAESGLQTLEMTRARPYDAITIDLHLPDMFGLTLLGRLLTETRQRPASVLVTTGYYGDDEMERFALQAGASAFRRKPLMADDVATVLRSIISQHAQAVDTVAPSASHAGGLIGRSQATRRLAEWIERIGPSSLTLLITGESGVGKELAARAIHSASARRNNPFIPVNCGAIPEGLLESELFGHAKGAFTGAVSDKPGLFETAHTGTVFLDEIAELPISMQARLLRALEEGEIRRVGDTRIRHIDVRIIAATNRNINGEICRGHFREDLYFRLAAATYHIPPLRDRLEDIEPLAQYWLRRLSVENERPPLSLSPGAIAVLHSYRWPGNVRELRNVLEYSLVWATGATLTDCDLSHVLSASVPAAPEPSSVHIDDPFHLLAALETHHWNRAAAARSLGIDRTTLWRRLKRLQARGRDHNA